MNNWSKLCLALSTFVSVQAIAQKPPLNHGVYDDWKNIGTANLSKSGNFLHYTITPQEGDALVELKDQRNTLLLRVPRGDNASLTENDAFFITGIKPFFSAVREAKIKKKKSEDMPKDSLLIFNVNAKTAPSKYADVKSYKLARNSREYVAFLAESKPAIVASDTVALKDSTTVSKNAPARNKAKAKTILHLLHLPTGDTTNFEGVDQYEWSADEKQLLITKKGDDKDSTLAQNAGLYLYTIADKSLKKISHGKGTYKQFSFSDDQSQLSFVAFKGDDKTLSKEYKLYYYTAQQDSAKVIGQQSSAGVPKNWWVSGDASLNFSADGQKLYLGLAPIPLVKDTTLVEFEHAKLDIWHWKDDYLQPQQLVNLKRDQARSFAAVVYPQSSGSIIPLSDETFNRVITTDSGNEEWVLVTSDYGNRIQSQWDLGTRSNIYKVSTKTGKNELILPNLSGQAYLSPKAEYAVFFDRETGSWHSYDIGKNVRKSLHEGLYVDFVDEENDVPALPGSYGLAGWSKDGQTVYIYDRYDIWAFDLSGKKPYMITNGYGRANKIELRTLRLAREDNPRWRTSYLSDKDQFLTAFDETTKENGFYSINSTKRSSDPKKILMQPKTYRRLMANADLSQVIYTKEDYQNSPDLYINNAKMDQERRLTEINTQQDSYNWGTAELVRWETPHGHAASGILYKPEDFDPNKKYPIIAYFYEKLSNGLYAYQAPAPTPSRLNIPYFVSNGYLVFAPDIAYETGYPGQAAEEYINSGMQNLARSNSWVDSTKMGIQGQSWGGYQVAHLITRTNMYAAAWTGAPVVNMTSAYGGIRWGSGMSRQFQYENTQSRIGQTLWEARDLYIENSPLFFMDRVNTPVVIMHNDQDGAVPWYQGIEMFTALRRLQKPVWLLNYNGDDHNLIQRQNRKDIQQREVQFFDHFLKGKPAPAWISSGVPAIHKGIEWGLDI
ncbi:prolyl oligopeptidase family serine peptidase [Sphingobacterium sp. lm-10]|uniref:S9 family peptidase n=1 Tax=Sphingobacterium sp. lm-10 TaxID=2944904 RepID=UPI00202260B0|nr:prolyl oligopeptidase family serine peptidase [Sphingobacterium sp. lm-10]MCL7987356.1 prolyl oligopeptidase family serine peptidase [Sphingobacterium sp. lm-10]